MRRLDLVLPSGLIGRASAPVLLYRKGQPFIPFTSYPQFIIVLAIFAVGISAFALFQTGLLKTAGAMHAALIGALIGAAVGIIPSVIASMPYSLKLNSPRPLPWVAFTRTYLVRSRLRRIETKRESEQEIWIPDLPWWRTWPNLNVVVTVGEEEVYVTGPRSMIMPLSRNWTRIQSLGPN